MCDVTRRDFLTGGAAMLGAISEIGARVASAAEIGKVDGVAADTYFIEGDLKGKIYCNNGWVIFEDYVLVIDANFPSGAKEVVSMIRALTEKPIRFAFDTHHHGDHVYGNQVMVDNGAVPLAHTGVIDELKKYETGYYDDQPGRWQNEAKLRPDVRESRLKPPSVLFPKELFFDDGKHRVELIHLGVAHTHGDAVAWLPKERILYTGDLCVNGPHNYVGDGNVEQWIKTLDAAQKLGAEIVCPGHGTRAGGDLLGDQQAYFKALREQVGRLVNAKKSAAEIQQAVPRMQVELSADRRIAGYVPQDSFASQVEKVLEEMTGEKFPAGPKAAEGARLWHAHQHGLQYHQV
jgi:cyclase